MKMDRRTILSLPGISPALFASATVEAHQAKAETAKAAAVAYVVCSAIGLETGTAVQDYIGLYGGDANPLTESLEYVQRTTYSVPWAFRQRSNC
jgi:hypothetical protein